MEMPILKFIWNCKGSWIAKIILKKKNKEESHSLTSDYTTRLQSSKQNDNDIKTDTQICGTGQKAQK